jgi:hypothetical protein
MTPDRCEGSVAIRCINGKEGSFDCASLEVLGHVYGCADGKCVAGSECTFMDDESCADGVVRFCLDGVWQDIDCASYGFSGCAAESSSGGTWAFCVE